MEKEGIGCLYLELQRRLLEDCDSHKCILRKDAIYKLTQVHIPKILLPAIFKEMEKAGLIIRVNRDEFAVVNCSKSNIISKPNKLYDEIGLF